MKITTSKSKNSESFYINHSYRNKDGKYTSKNIIRLGTLEELSKKLNTDRDGVMAWAKEQARIETEKYNKEQEAVSISFSPTLLIDVNQDRIFNCGYLFLQALMSNLQLYNICRNIKTRHNYSFNLEAILSNLIYSRILSNTFSLYDYAHTLLEKPKYSHEDVDYALRIIAQENDYIQHKICSNISLKDNRNSKSIYYDYSHCFLDSNQNDNFTGLGLLINNKGIPLSFDLHQKDKENQNIINNLTSSSFLYCSDHTLQEDELFTTSNSILVQPLKQDDYNIALNTKRYQKVGSNTLIDLMNLDMSAKEVLEAIYYQELPLDNKQSSKRCIILYFPKISKHHMKLHHNQTKSLLDEGFYKVHTNLTSSIKSIVDIIKQRQLIEEYFSNIQTTINVKPNLLTYEDKVKINSLINFLAFHIIGLLESKLEYKYSSEEILTILKTMNLRFIGGQGYIPTYVRTPLSDALHDVVGFRTDYQIIKSSKIKEIIRDSKKQH